MNHTIKYENIADSSLNNIIDQLVEHENKIPLTELKLIDLIKDNNDYLTNGIYLLFNQDDKAVYIGKASNFIIDRFPQHLMIGNVGKMRNNELLVKYICKYLNKDISDWNNYIIAFEAVKEIRILIINTRFFDGNENKTEGHKKRLKFIDNTEKTLIRAFYTFHKDTLLNTGVKNFSLQEMGKTLRQHVE